MEFNKQANEKQEFDLIWKPIIGFVLCILLTAFTLWGALYSGAFPKVLFIAISVITFIQAVQLLLQVQTQE
ncbi:cytochrome C oxidase subunit IV family protein [Virgibacillus necropolis]|uniref:Uncharacterized protein n=1 Tax=Virgibacillus necropolis TaxID=163877 RepID=A0A221MER1_9BACI|nr:hypothetical protein [Virgibacillus necropolis]ASN06124.1 hypothetical protein CFK40_14390 [Virgibacillus necropolis]